MYKFGAYWSARKERITDCSVRVKSSIDGLALIDPSLSSWQLIGGSKRCSYLNPEVPFADYESALLRGQNRRDSDKTVIPSLGSRLMLHNGLQRSESISLSIKCGLYSENDSLTNSVILSLPERGKLAYPSVLSVAADIFSVFFQSWDPDWMSLYSLNDLRSSSKNNREPIKGKFCWTKDKNFESFKEGLISLNGPLKDAE